jgi:hypothetical protein
MPDPIISFYLSSVAFRLKVATANRFGKLKKTTWLKAGRQKGQNDKLT